jgi:hypothetical protein
MQEPREHQYRSFFLALLLVCFCFNLFCCFTAFNNQLLDRHSFRQTQTALTVYYFLKDGYSVNYQTPILGTPWRIPFEFPLYQWIVALLKQATSMSVESCGRIVSILFFYLALIPAYCLLRRISNNRNVPLLIISLVLAHPIYLFWTRAFMIESTALFFSIAYTWLFAIYIDNRKAGHFLLALATGVIAALVKITTLLPWMACASLFLIWKLYEERNKASIRQKILRHLYTTLFLFLIPIATIKYWVSFSDEIKSANLYAYSITSSEHLQQWNFGSLSQRFLPITWAKIFANSGLQMLKSIPGIAATGLFYLFLAFVVLLALRQKKSALKLAGISFFLYLVAPILFVNLHFVHTYYTYANSIFFCAALGFVMYTLICSDTTRIRMLGIVFATTAVLFFLAGYFTNYYPHQVRRDTTVTAVSDFIKKHTTKDDVLLIYGDDWNSQYSFYSERRSLALCNRFNSIDDSLFRHLETLHNGYNISCMVWVDDTSHYKKQFLAELVEHLDLKPVYQIDTVSVFLRSIPSTQ